LALLRSRYGERWSIRRTEHLWIATALDRDADHAPTLIEPDVKRLVQQMEDPPARAGGRSPRPGSPTNSSKSATASTGRISRPVRRPSPRGR
ncbi:hypothetical protein ACFFN5_23055, partial [Streptomonospora salina]